MLRHPTAGWIVKRAATMFAGLIGMLFLINALNVVNSYVGRDFMTAIENRDTGEFIRQAFLYIGTFALITLVAVLYRYVEERLGLYWREWLTRHLVNTYLEHPTYYRLNERLANDGEVPNPDQRIADDVRTFTVTTLSFVLMILNGLFTMVAFSGVLWSINPWLFLAALVYAALGSYWTFVLGRPLVGLNYRQSDKEANFRSSLVHVREHAESIAVQRREARIRTRILRRVDDLVENFLRMIRVNRNLGYFTTGYNYLIQVLPALIVAPMFIRGDAEFGVITQASMAFAHLVGAFSLVVTQFQSLSSFAAVIARLGSLVQGMEQARQSAVGALEMRREDARLSYENLSLWAPGDGKVLLDQLSVSIPLGTRVLVRGSNKAANAALFRATAGVWDSGEGNIVRPNIEQIMFLPERPYLPPGTLKEVLLRTHLEATVSAERILKTLELLEMGHLLERAGGLEIEQDWDSLLSLGEQQMVAFARLLIAAPRFACLDRLSSTLDPERVVRLLGILTAHSISYVNFGEAGESHRLYDAVLDIGADGHWTYVPVERDIPPREPRPDLDPS